MIQLRQSDAIDITANGEYECMMAKDVIIENGDIVQLNKCFVDSIREGDINITEDLTLTIQSGVYFFNWLSLVGNTQITENFINNQGELVPTGGTGAEGGYAPSGKRFIPYLGIEGTNLQDYSRYQIYNYNINYSGNAEPSFTITYSYEDYMGTTQYFHTTFPAISAGSTKKQYGDFFNVIAKNNSLKIVSPSLSFFMSFGITPDGAVGVPLAGKNYVPFIFTTTVNLPNGIYSPNQISTYISQQLSSASLGPNSDSQNMNETFFQFAISDFDNNKANPNGQLNPNGTPSLLEEQTKFISDDGVYKYEFATGNNNFIGTSQIALEYNQDSDKFEFTYLHMPMLDASVGQNMSVRYIRRGLQSEGIVFGATEHSGIYFNSLTAKNKNGRLVDFWSGVLGFDLNTLTVGCSNFVEDKYQLTGIISLSDPLIEGVNITSGYFGLDSAVIRGTAGTPNTWYSRSSVPGGNAPWATSQDGICSTINSTNAISAVKTLDILLNKFSHYILQTDLGFNNNNYIGEKWYRNINGIIEKFFSYGSYTYGSSDSAIQYVHSGAPIQLKSIRVRILKSDITRDENLGEDNTVIMQIIKAGPQSNKN